MLEMSQWLRHMLWKIVLNLAGLGEEVANMCVHGTGE